MFENKAGRCFVDNDVIDEIIGMTAIGVEGVEKVAGYDEGRNRLRYNHSHHIITETGNGRLTTKITIEVDRDANIVDLVREVHDRISQAVEVMLGLECKRVDIVVE